MFIAKCGMVGIGSLDTSLYGGYGILFKLVLLFTCVLRGVCGTFCMNYCGICKWSIVVLIVSIWLVVPTLQFWW